MVKHIVGLGFDAGNNRLVAHVYFLNTFNFHKLQAWKIFKSCGHVCYLLQTFAECVKLSEYVIFTDGMTKQSWVKKVNIGLNFDLELTLMLWFTDLNSNCRSRGFSCNFSFIRWKHCWYSWFSWIHSFILWSSSFLNANTDQCILSI